MSKNNFHTIQLNSNDLISLLKSLSASDYYHKNLEKSDFSYPNELNDIIKNNDRIKQILKDSLNQSLPLCPRPSETSPLGEVDGGIL